MATARTPLEFRGNNLLIQSYVNPPRPAEFILEGGAETGKTYATLHLLDALARQYAKARLAIVRQVHTDLAATVLEIWKREFVAPSGDIKAFGGEMPIFYEYPNGTRIWVFGMDRAGHVLSGAFDGIYFNQVEEATDDTWEVLGTRTTGRAGVIKPGLLFGDCNPRGSSHWILKRARANKLKLLPTTHKDNPALFDANGELTEQGRVTMERLSGMTGVRRKRLFLHLWVTPEGTVFDLFDRDTHVTHRDLKEFQWFLLTLDEGYTNPAVTLVVGVDADLRFHVCKEFYKTGVLPSAHVSQAERWARQFRTRLVVVDASAAGLIAELQSRSGLTIEASKGHVHEGIARIQEMLKVRSDDRPRLTVEPDCKNTADEFETYSYKKGTEDPIKADDHAMDALRNAAYYVFGGAQEEQEVVYQPVRIGLDW